MTAFPDFIMPVFPNEIKNRMPSKDLEWDVFADTYNYRLIEVANRFAERFCIELNDIIIHKLNQDEVAEYLKVISFNYNILIFILYPDEHIRHGTSSDPFRRVYSNPAFPWFIETYDFLLSHISDIRQIAQTLRNDICNDFPLD